MGHVIQVFISAVIQARFLMGDYSSMRWNGRRRRKEEEEKSVKCIWDLPKRNSEKWLLAC
jgi:hypothetical protein